MVATVVDTCCMKYFQEQRVSEGGGTYLRMMELVFDRGEIAVDSDGQAIHEYEECCRPSAVGMNLSDWIAENLASGKIKLFPMDHCMKKKLREFGLPAKDQKWPAIAKGSGSDLIITDDIDLFDPKAKAMDAAKKCKIKASGGPVSKFLSKSHGIEVQPAELFVAGR